MRRPSPAMIVALLALFVALGGTGYAALTVTGKNVKNGSLTGQDVKDKSLTKRDFRGSTRGPQGPKGDKGDKGDRGPKGDRGAQGPGATFIEDSVALGENPSVPLGYGLVFQPFCAPPGFPAAYDGALTVTPADSSSYFHAWGTAYRGTSGGSNVTRPSITSAVGGEAFILMVGGPVADLDITATANPQGTTRSRYVHIDANIYSASRCNYRVVVTPAS